MANGLGDVKMSGGGHHIVGERKSGHGSRDGVVDGGYRGSRSGETESHVWVCSLSHGEVVRDK